MARGRDGNAVRRAFRFAPLVPSRTLASAISWAGTVGDTYSPFDTDWAIRRMYLARSSAYSALSGSIIEPQWPEPRNILTLKLRTGNTLVRVQNCEEACKVAAKRTAASRGL